MEWPSCHPLGQLGPPSAKSPRRVAILHTLGEVSRVLNVAACRCVGQAALMAPGTGASPELGLSTLEPGQAPAPRSSAESRNRSRERGGDGMKCYLPST